MNQYSVNPLFNASFETLDKVSKELGLEHRPENDFDIDILYQKIQNIDLTNHDTHAAHAAYHARYMAETYFDYSLSQMREHIYNLSRCCFNKILLNPGQKKLFDDWATIIELLPVNATPFEIYYCSSPRIMSILGR
jgi:hypothetical protein